MSEHKFKHFEKVLVRDDEDEVWIPQFFSYYDENSDYPYSCMGDAFMQCIPYEGNEHLLNTTDEPKKPQDGDFVVSGWENNGCKCQWIAIVKGRYEDDSYATYYGLYTINNGSDKRGSWFDEYCDSQSYTRNATDEEKQFLLDKMHEAGKDWDAENKKVVDWQWKPKPGEIVLLISYNEAHGRFIPLEWKFNPKELRANMYNHGMMFSVKHDTEANEFAEHLNQAIKNVK